MPPDPLIPSIQPSVQPSVQGLFGEAVSRHASGHLGHAECLCLQVLALDSRHADTLHLLGVIAHQSGRHDVAESWMRKAIAADRSKAAYHCNLGKILQAQKRSADAAMRYKRALSLDPCLPEAHLNFGALLQEQGRLSEAADRYRRALALRPSLLQGHLNLGTILESQGSFEAATESYRKALALDPSHSPTLTNFGNTLQFQGKLQEAFAAYTLALENNPAYDKAHCNLGSVQLALGQTEDAIASYARALELNPRYFEAHYNLGIALLRAQQPESAIASHQRALALRPNSAEAHLSLAGALYVKRDFHAAHEAAEQAIAISPHFAEAYYNSSCILSALGLPHEALTRCRYALTLQPDFPNARFHESLTQLFLTDFAGGWSNYESRWHSPGHDTPARCYPQPLWDGQPLSHESQESPDPQPPARLFLWAEQGIGDEIMFASILPEVIQTGVRVTLECHPRLRPLFARSFPALDLISTLSASTLSTSTLSTTNGQKATGQDETGQNTTDRVTETESCQPFPPGTAAHLPIGSLPSLFRRTTEAFGNTPSPYLIADPALRDEFRARYSGPRRLVGLAWHTNGVKTGAIRSIDLTLLASLLPGIRTQGEEESGLPQWVSLQYGDHADLAAQIRAAKIDLLLDPTVDQLRDMDTFAAQVAAMDLVIAIDNSTAHLAAALGVPTWVLLPYAPDWRWLEGRADSLWYPAMRLFRQPRLNDWPTVIAQVRRELPDALALASI